MHNRGPLCKSATTRTTFKSIQKLFLIAHTGLIWIDLASRVTDQITILEVLLKIPIGRQYKSNSLNLSECNDMLVVRLAHAMIPQLSSSNPHLLSIFRCK